ncbi:D-alanyl-D-alanine carboxypeptidase DacA [Peribacillus frigoritolerans]|uniref:D-alanyl-D-alanine carboxypeptidase family protein n=1 Tax=Peribacillus frigoritolerans TaxID=450367 RepID=UPI000B2E3E95|nr:D-alanyl-D-alanine carboxypeptidase family protein [Peribacillus frigoritolerans]PHD70641.1 D-alanyl-D-alanine carboxypeptidase [Bacillus sp. AFS043905]PRS23539.1 D-alanyl-D-alanine carboxypeptidase [Bacillus sp. RJGP41]MCY8936406.1 D-alanyl-D-alanine carboxypeptidase [Peribacillus frigoritolerans]MED3712226.1 D-alanyl-D-alanine carboxypeptidase [Peribacillus frigoritolerans]ULM97255.1 D-alanyl-D-alanine carboxypeptidase [Peribacillus frigoritolerans]
MKKISKITLIFTFVFVLVMSQFAYQPGEAVAESDNLGLKAEAAIIIDGETGQIVYEKNADKVLGIASMSKMMTEYIIMESIENGKISWDQKVKINKYVHDLSKAPNLSNVGLTEGEDYTVKELYQAMAVYSGNAATVALAQLVSGSEKSFVKLMNEKAKELGLKHHKFVNASGLNNSDLLGQYPSGDEDDENIMTAKDTALLAYRLINDYPEVLKIASIPKLKFRDGKEYPNFNWMLPGLIFEYKGVDGLKTGSTDFAGYGHTGTVIRDGQRYITVVMKSTNKNERFADSTKLMNYAYATFKKEKVLPANYQVKGKETLSVVKGKEKDVKIQSEKAIELLVENGGKDNYKTDLVIDKNKLNDDGKLTAPIKKGEKLGYITVTPKKGEDYGYINGDPVKVNVVAAESVEKANWFVLSMRAVGGFFGDVWSSVASTVKGWF